MDFWKSKNGLSGSDDIITMGKFIFSEIIVISYIFYMTQIGIPPGHYIGHGLFSILGLKLELGLPSQIFYRTQDAVLGFISGIGGLNRALYPMQDEHHYLCTVYDGHPRSNIGHKVAISGFISGIGLPSCVLFRA